jgi:hypothetical protein
MAATPVQIVTPVFLATTTAAPIYTAPAAKKVLITKISFTNIGAVADSIDVHIVTSAGVVGTSNKIISAKIIDAAECWACYQIEGEILNSGDKLYAKAGIASNVNVMASGVELI